MIYIFSTDAETLIIKRNRSSKKQKEKNSKNKMPLRCGIETGYNKGD
jgi:hypothetical protein